MTRGAICVHRRVGAKPVDAYAAQGDSQQGGFARNNAGGKFLLIRRSKSAMLW